MYKTSPVDILCLDETKLDNCYPDTELFSEDIEIDIGGVRWFF